MEMEVVVESRQRQPVNRKRLAEAARKSLAVEQFSEPAELSIVLVDDKQIRRLNKQYRGTDRPTDVLAFGQLKDYAIDIPGEPVILGDVVISVETAERQAAEMKHSLAEELDLLVIHGVLHLLGYSDETDAEAAQMRKRERAILGQLRDGRRAE